MSDRDLRIEFPSAGATYSRELYGVYQYGTYPNSSVLAGQQSRSFLDSFPTLEEAKAAYPEAIEAGCGYRPPYLNHLPDDDGEADLAYRDGVLDSQREL